MRILFIVSNIAILGGIERVVCRLANYLTDNLNYDITIISIYKEKRNLKFNLSKKVKIVFCEKSKKELSKNKVKNLFIILNNYLDEIKIINKVIKKYKFDIIITFHTEISNSILFIKLWKKMKVIVTEHSEYESVDPFTKIIRKGLFKKADRVIVLTEGSKKIYEKFLTNVKVIPNSLSFKSEKISNLKNKRVVAIGRLSKEKGFDRLIKMYSNLIKYCSEWRLDIIGEGIERKKLENLIKLLNVENNIKILGYREDIKTELINSDINVVPSRSESFSLSIIEAMECGVPTIAFDLVGPSEIIENDVTGLLIENNNTKKMEEKLLYLIQNKEIGKRYSIEAKKEVQKYNIEEIIKVWDELFKTVVRIGDEK